MTSFFESLKRKVLLGIQKSVENNCQPEEVWLGRKEVNILLEEASKNLFLRTVSNPIEAKGMYFLMLCVRESIEESLCCVGTTFEIKDNDIE